MDNFKKRLLRFIIIFIGLLIWEILVSKGKLNEVYMSSPTRIIKDLKEFYITGDLKYHGLITFKEVIFGLLIGSFLGILFGVIFSQAKKLGEILVPIISGFSGIPQLTLAPLYILWFGFGTSSKIFLSSLMVFFGVFFATFNGIKNLDQDIIEASYMLGASSIKTLINVVIPASLPWIISGIKRGVSSSVVGSVIGEYMGSIGGLGWMVSYAASYFDMSRVMSCVLVILFFNLIMDTFLSWVENKLLFWKIESNINIDK